MEVQKALDKADCEESLAAYTRYMWPVVEPGTPLVWGWVGDALCEHLEAVTDGSIKRLLINVPPGSMKTSICSTFWPSWEWGPQNLAHYRYIMASYASNLTELANGRLGRLVASERYQALWGDRVKITRMGDVSVVNKQTGWTLATGVQGVGTGRRGDRIIIDDPNNVKDAESKAIREETNRWFQETMPDRLNNLTESAIVVIQQRTHAEDVSGLIIAKQFGYVHLSIPAEYDSRRHCTTVIGWQDPRGTARDEYGDLDPYGEPLSEFQQAEHDGEIFWPERFPAEALAEQKLIKGPYGYAGQYQQSPQARGGSIIKSEWWQFYGARTHPAYELVIACLDTNQSQKEENDYSALSIMGVFQHSGRANAMLCMSWRSRLELNVTPLTDVERRALGLDRNDLTAWERGEVLGGRLLPKRAPAPERGEIRRGFTPMERCRVLERIDALGLVDKVAAYCEGYKVDRLLIENKANGFAADGELRRQFPTRNWTIDLIDPGGKDKSARAHASVPAFAAGLIWAPGNPDTGLFKDWAQQAVEECAVLPRGAHDDVADTIVHGVNWLRQQNILLMAPEITERENRARDYEHTKTVKALYPG